MGVEDLEDGVVGTPPSGNSHTHSGEHTRPRTRSKGPSHDLVVASFEASLKNTTMSMHRLTSLERYHHSNLSIDASGSLHVVAPGDEADGQKAAGGFFDLPARQKLCILAIAVADFFSGTSYSLIAPFFPEEGLQKGATSTQVGLIIGCFQLVGFIISPILGKHMSRIGSKFTFIAGIFLGGCCTILFGLLNLVPDGTQFVAWSFIVRSFQALGMHAFTTASYAIIAHEFPDQISTIFGILETFFGVGMMCGPPIGGALYQAGGYTLPFVVVGVCLLIATVVNYVMLPAGVDVSSSGSQNFLRMLLIPSTLIAVVNVVAGALSLGFLEATLALFLSDQFALSFTIIGFIFLVPSAMYACLAPVWGWLGDAKGRCKLLMLTATTANTVAFAFLGPAPIFAFDAMLWLVIICLLLQGFAIGGQLVPGMLDMLNSARWHDYPDDFETYGLIAGLFHSCVALGAFAGPSLGGFLYEAVGFPWSSTIIAAFQLFTLICTLLYILTHIRVEVMNEVPEHAFTAVVDTDDDETRALLKGKDGKLYAGQCELTRSGEVIFYGSQQEEKGGKGEADTEIGRGGAEEAESDVDAKMT